MNRRALTPWIGWALAVLLIAAGCALGSWQLRRMHQKEAMLAAVADVLRQRLPQPLALAADPSRAQAYDWAAGSGRFLPQPAWLLDNQQRDGQPGVRVFRLFQPDAAAPGGSQPANTRSEAQAMPLLVDMGWLPMSAGRQLPQLAPPPAGMVALRGLLLAPPARGLLAGAESRTADGQHLVIALEPATIAARSGLPAIAPRILRLDPALPFGYARDLDVLPNTLPPQRHLGYAVQWFALAAAVFLIALVLTLRHCARHRRRP